MYVDEKVTLESKVIMNGFMPMLHPHHPLNNQIIRNECASVKV